MHTDEVEKTIIKPGSMHWLKIYTMQEYIKLVTRYQVPDRYRDYVQKLFKVYSDDVIYVFIFHS